MNRYLSPERHIRDNELLAVHGGGWRKAGGMAVAGPHDHVQQAEERGCFHRVREERQFRVRAPPEDVRDVLPVLLFVDLQGPGGLLPPEDEGVEFHSSHTITILPWGGGAMKVRRAQGESGRENHHGLPRGSAALRA